MNILDTVIWRTEFSVMELIVLDDLGQEFCDGDKSRMGIRLLYYNYGGVEIHTFR